MTNQELMTKLQAAELGIYMAVASVHGVVYPGQVERRDALKAEAAKRGLIAGE